MDTPPASLRFPAAPSGPRPDPRVGLSPDLSPDPSPAARAGRVSDAVELAGGGPARGGLARLVATAVQGRVAFEDAAAASPEPGNALPFYTNPAARHAAATAIAASAIGGAIDVEG